MAALYNERLADQRRLSDERKDLLQAAYVYLDAILKRPHLYSKSPKECIELVHKQEHLMQFLWDFEQDSRWYRYEFDIKGCTCPKMDNDDYRGTDMRVFNVDCPIHKVDNGKDW